MYIHSHHKCASRWMIAYLREVCRLNEATFHAADHTDLVRKSDADITFFGNSLYAPAATKKLFGIHVVRHPLSLLVSAYYSHKYSHPTKDWRKLEFHRQSLQSADLVGGLYLSSIFLEHPDINDGAVGPFHALRTWDYDDDRFLTIRMEDAVKNPRNALGAKLSEKPLILPPNDAFEFSVFAEGRVVGEARPDAHYRSGREDEWREVVPRPLRDYCRWAFDALLERHYPDMLS